MLVDNPRNQVRSLIAVAVGLVALAVVAIGLALWGLRSDAIEDATNETGNIATILAEQTSRSVQVVDLVLSDIQERIAASHPALRDDQNALLGDKALNALLNERLARLPQAAAIAIVDANGKLVNTTRAWPTPSANLADRDYFNHFKTTADSGLYVSRPVKNAVNGEPTIYFSKRISGSAGRFDGVLLIGLNLKHFHDIYDSITSLRNQSFLFLRKDGVVLVRHPDPLNRSGEMMPAASPWHQLVLQGGGHYRSPGYFDSEARLVAVRPVSRYPLVVNVAYSENAALARWRSRATSLGIATLLAVLCAVLLLRAVNTQFRRLFESETALEERKSRLAMNSQLLEAAKLQLDAAVTNMSQGLCMFDEKQRLIVCNARYAELYGLDPQQVRPGMPLKEIVDLRYKVGSCPAMTKDEYLVWRNNIAVSDRPADTNVELMNGRIIGIRHRPLPEGGWVATHEDITEARRREESFRLLFDNNPVPMWVRDIETLQFLAVNEAAIKHYGYSREQFLEMTLIDLRLPEERNKVVRTGVRASTGTQQGERIWRHQTADGRKIEVVVYSRALTYEGRAASLVAITDITARNLVERELRRTRGFLDSVIENVPVSIVVKEPTDRRFILVNRAAEQLLGVSRDELIGQSDDDLFPEETEARAKAPADTSPLENSAEVSPRQSVAVDEKMSIRGRGERIVNKKRFTVCDDSGTPQYLVGVIEDVTDHRRAQKDLFHMAHHDALTGLANRVLFRTRLNEALVRARRQGHGVSAFCIDVDHFKTINDTFGHPAGDTVLRSVAERLQSCCRETDTVARLGGDEFAIIQDYVKGPGDTNALAQRILTVMSTAIRSGEHDLPVSTSIGVATAPADGDDADTVLKNADTAVYRAKADGRGAVRFFEPVMDARLQARRILESELRAALSRNEFELFYQPEIDAKTNEVSGIEALLRWRHPQRGMVSPAEFIPLAEEIGLIFPLGEWVLREACEEATRWPAHIKVAVNLSPLQFKGGSLASVVVKALTSSGLAPQRLELEITESVLLQENDENVAVLHHLRSLGVSVAIDDFGTGHSSLSYLRSFPFDKIKIDRSFVSELPDNLGCLAIVRAVARLANDLGMRSNAEGVETPEQLACLQGEGISEMQGYLFSPPRRAAEIRRFILGSGKKLASVA
jgi:diguanylate cyclase (GGDEF)-like protein/PAS domain S-box-containing protein